MKVAMVGAGAMGGSFGGMLAHAGNDVRLIDGWQAHVAAINDLGLRVEGAVADQTVRVPAETSPSETGWADWAVVFTLAPDTAAAADTVAAVLAPQGRAVTMQNGIGNVEALSERLGAERVVGGSSMCSAATIGPGHVALTHLDTSAIGELDGNNGDSVAALAELLRGAGFDIEISDNIMVKIWTKFLVNCGINALCAVTGMRTGEMTRVPELYALQGRVIDEALAVTDALGIELTDPDIKQTIRKAAHYRFNKPSMLQHVSVGRRTEIDSINGALVRKARELGIATPCNEALVALLKGVELASERAIHDPDLDYADWERRIAAEPLPD